MPRYTIVEAVACYATAYRHYIVNAPSATQALEDVRTGEVEDFDDLAVECHDAEAYAYAIGRAGVGPLALSSKATADFSLKPGEAGSCTAEAAAIDAEDAKGAEQ